MRCYYDSGVLVKLYLQEAYSDRVTDFVVLQRQAVSFHGFHELEIGNALRLKVFRKEITEAQNLAITRRIAGDIRHGLLERRRVDWEAALLEALRVSALATGRSGCRSLDILHVAAAVIMRAELFVSLDDRQLKAAVLSGLKVLDVRSL